MGQAKRRGTPEQRKAEAIAKQEEAENKKIEQANQIMIDIYNGDRPPEDRAIANKLLGIKQPPTEAERKTARMLMAYAGALGYLRVYRKGGE